MNQPLLLRLEKQYLGFRIRRPRYPMGPSPGFFGVVARLGESVWRKAESAAAAANREARGEI